MSTPNAGIPYVPEGTLDPAAGLNLSLNVIDALLQTAVISMSLTAPPGGEDDGDLYIVAGPATGDWAGQENNLARYVEEGDFWQFYVAGTQVKMVFNRADGNLHIFDVDSSPSGWIVFSGSGLGVITRAEIGLFFPGGPPSASQLLAKYVAARSMIFPADFAGSFGNVGTNPSGSFTITVSVNGASAGTIVVSTGGVFTFATTGNAPVLVVAGEVIELEAPAGTDGTIADIAATLVADYDE